MLIHVFPKPLDEFNYPENIIRRLIQRLDFTLVLNEPGFLCSLRSHTQREYYFRNQVLAASVYHLPKYYKLACEKIPISNLLEKSLTITNLCILAIVKLICFSSFVNGILWLHTAYLEIQNFILDRWGSRCNHPHADVTLPRSWCVQSPWRVLWLPLVQLVPSGTPCTSA